MFFLQKADFLLITLFSAPGRSGLGPDATVSGTGCPALAAVKRERGNVPSLAGPMVNGSGQRPPCRRAHPRTMLCHPSCCAAGLKTGPKGNDQGVDNPDPRRNLHRPRDQRLSARRVLIRRLFLREPLEWGPR